MCCAVERTGFDKYRKIFLTVAIGYGNKKQTLKKCEEV